MLKTCENCSSVFTCGGDCWCEKFPPIFKPTNKKDCLCAACLAKEMEVAIKDYMTDITPDKMHQVRMLGKPDKLHEHIDFEVNEFGNMELSAWYLLRQGTCCENDCKHCPYYILDD